MKTLILHINNVFFFISDLIIIIYITNNQWKDATTIIQTIRRETHLHSKSSHQIIALMIALEIK